MSIKYVKLQKHIGEMIKNHRQLGKNFTLEELGEHSELDSTNIGRLERGEQLPIFPTFIKLANKLDITLDHNDIKTMAKLIEEDES